MLTSLKTRISSQPFNLFLVTAILLLVFSFMTRGQSIDIHIHDTLFVISTILFIWALGITLLLIWAIYKLTSKFLWARFLTWFHVAITIFVLLVLLTENFWHDKLIPPIKGDIVSFDTFQTFTGQEKKIILPLIILFLAGQLAFILNVIGG
jgi:hypothetical protein